MHTSFNSIAKRNGLCTSLLLKWNERFISMHRHNEKITGGENQLCRLGLRTEVKHQEELLLRSAEDLIWPWKVLIIYMLGLCNVSLC